MKLLFIRHGDPDYSTDSLTEKGIQEARLLAGRMGKTQVDECFVSPLGRAQLTAKPCLEAMHMDAKTLKWLREFDPQIMRPDDTTRTHICWDWLPEDLAVREHFYKYDEWFNDDILKASGVKEAADEVWDGLDDLLASHGYVRDGHIYRAVRPNNDTLALFCHFGVTTLMLAHLFSASPMVLWHSLISAPTSVTTVVSEERREGIASFRMTSFGDTGHLYEAGEKPAFSGRFCECFFNEDERH